MPKTETNLKKAFAGESEAYQKYMAYAQRAAAKTEKKAGPEISFRHSSAVEKVHHELFKKALEDPHGFPVRDYYICPACGYILAGKPGARCPVCGAVKKSFQKAD